MDTKIPQLAIKKWFSYQFIHKRIFFKIKIADQENSLKVDANDNHEVGVDVDNDDDMPLMGDMDSIDHDSNDMSRPRKIRR